MAKNSKGDVQMAVTADVNGLNAGINNAKKNLTGLQKFQDTLLKQMKKSMFSWGDAFKIAIANMAVTMGVGFVTGFIKGIANTFSKSAGFVWGQFKESFESNMKSEKVNIAFGAILNNKDLGGYMINMLREHALATGANIDETLEVGRSLLTKAGGDPKKLLAFVKIAQRMQALNPDKDLKEAAFSLKETIEGDFQSIYEQFGISKIDLRNFRDKGTAGDKAIDIILKRMNVTDAAVQKMANSVASRIGFMESFIEEFRRLIGEGIFNSISGQIGKITNWLKTNSVAIMDLARGIGIKLGEFYSNSMQALQSVMPNILGAIQALKGLANTLINDGTVSKLFNFIVNGIRNGVEKMADIINALTGGKFLSGLWELFKSFAKLMGDIFIAGAEVISDAVSEAIYGRSYEQGKLDRDWEKWGKKSREEQLAHVKMLKKYEKDETANGGKLSENTRLRLQNMEAIMAGQKSFKGQTFSGKVGVAMDNFNTNLLNQITSNATKRTVTHDNFADMQNIGRQMRLEEQARQKRAADAAAARAAADPASKTAKTASKRLVNSAMNYNKTTPRIIVQSAGRLNVVNATKAF